MKTIWLALGFLLTTAFVACSTTPKTPMTAPKAQEVVFQDAEVPYIQAIKKDGKMSAVIVDATISGKAAE